MNNSNILAVCGYSNSGKTTVLKHIITRLKAQGFTVGVIKHGHHDMDIDIPGKDSYVLRHAGAEQTLVVCDNRYAMIRETQNKPVEFTTLVEQFTDDIDLILVEGFKDEKIPKIMCHRKETNQPLFIDEYTIAIASNVTLDVAIPVLDINQPDQLVQLIKTYFFDK